VIVGSEAAAAIIVIAALWVAFAAALAILAAKRIRRAQSVLGATRSMRSLLDAAPARAVLIHADGSVEADARLVQELGLPGVPLKIGDLVSNDGGIDRDDLSSLIDALADVRLGGAALRRQLRLAGGDRVLELRAALAPPPAKPGSVLAWLFDISEADVERGTLPLLDAREPERFRGESEPMDPVAGHIPGARNAPSQELAPGGRFLGEAELRQRLGDEPFVASCGSGITATTLLLAAEIAGVEGRLYPGSWSEWSRRGLPAETGEG